MHVPIDLRLPPTVSVAAAISLAIAILAWRARSLSLSGALAASAVGTVALRAGWGWGLYLLLWFVLAALLSRIGRAKKAARVAIVVAKGSERDARQVLANGGVFALCALVIVSDPSLATPSSVAAAAALAAAGADTWATEIGTLAGGNPWSLRLGTTVPFGTSGAVTWAGSVGGLMGAVILAWLSLKCGMITLPMLVAVVFGALGGMWSDSALGAWWQLRLHCPRCNADTEQDMHGCGTRTVRTGGVTALENDAVNFICTLVGASVAAFLPQ